MEHDKDHISALAEGAFFGIVSNVKCWPFLLATGKAWSKEICRRNFTAPGRAAHLRRASFGNRGPILQPQSQDFLQECDSSVTSRGAESAIT